MVRTVPPPGESGDSRGMGLSPDDAEALFHEDRAAFLALALPGATLDANLELRVVPAWPTKYVRDEYDLRLGLSEQGTYLHIESMRGAEAIAALPAGSVQTIHR